MPELPEVETTRRSLLAMTGQRVHGVIVRQSSLRQPVPDELPALLKDSILQQIRRRAKYLLLDFDAGCLIVHLGMSGSLRRVEAGTPLRIHDHVDLQFAPGEPLLRYHDPRRFGLILWGGQTPLTHPLLSRLGLEPLEDAFTGAWLHQASRERKTPIKVFLMDPSQVVGIGNIYASEALFRAGIAPQRPAGSLSRAACLRLRDAVRTTLQEALDSGGSTLRDYVDGSGASGWFQLELRVYGRADAPCLTCGTPIRQQRQAQRSTFWCPRCQR